MKDIIKPNLFTDSTSKQKWSFSKSKRFVQNKTYNQNIFYNNDSSLTKTQRTASFGVGKRKSFIDNSMIVQPTKYNIPSQFDNKAIKNKGFSFGTGRDQTKINNYLKLYCQTPASNVYNLDLADKSKSKDKGITIKQRTIYPPNYFLPNNPQSQRIGNLPGPSSYKTIDQIGDKCIQSKRKNFSQKFSNTQRFRRIKDYGIGPGSYDDKTISADGQYILSTMKSAGKRTIFKGYRKSMFQPNNIGPGPASYDIVGDFGKLINMQTLNTEGSKANRSFKVSRPQTARN